MSYDEEILEYMDFHRNDIIALEQKLIQTKSVTGDEAQVAKLVAEECEKDGLSVELVEPAPKRVNVVAKYKGTTGKPKVMWYSHYDTLPSGDESDWKHPPFSAAIDDGWIYGRGAGDNKTATCASITAFRAVKNLGIKLKGDMVFTHVADEEKGGKFGFKNLIEKGYGDNIDFLFYAHSGSPNQITIASNGECAFDIEIKGKSAHTANNEEGINAVQNAARLILRLQKLGDEVNARRYHVPGTNSIMKSRFSINRCIGYVADNSVPERCELRIDRRWTPGETLEQVQGEIKRAIDEWKAEDPKFNATLTVTPGMDLSVSAADSELVKVIQRSAKKLGYDTKPEGGSHSSDHGFFNSRYHKPLASYGIGGERFHQTNERIKVDDVILTAKVHGLVMVDLLGAA
jgi:acetylornithine deacetylase/succinyl-diaminopimelate desuccinylase family protein